METREAREYLGKQKRGQAFGWIAVRTLCDAIWLQEELVFFLELLNVDLRDLFGVAVLKEDDDCLLKVGRVRLVD